MLYRFDIKTKERDMVNITNLLTKSIKNEKFQNGLAIVYCPHTTGAITINENADPAVVHDLILAEKKFFPKLNEYQHGEGNSDAHLLSSLIGVSETIIVADGRPLLGVWQNVYFCEFDGPRNRTVYVKLISEDKVNPTKTI